MTVSLKPAMHAPTSAKGGRTSSSSDPQKNATSRQRQFVVMALNMTWQLAVVVLVPILAGVQLDKALDTSVYLFVGLAVALIASVGVMWRTLQVANSLPVPKLSAKQKRDIQKSYEEEDDEK